MTAGNESQSDVPKDIRGVGINLCQVTRQCPASHYLVCGCLETGKNCWEVVNKPCCKRDDFERCLSCETYIDSVRQYESSQQQH